MVPLSPLALQKVISGQFVGCVDIHPYSCERHALTHSLRMLFLALKVYIPVHVISTLLRSKPFRLPPSQLLLLCLKNILRSCLFISLYSGIIRYALCRLGQLTNSANRFTLSICVLLGSFAVILETPRRRTELALFLLPRALESVWKMMKMYKIAARFEEMQLWGFAGAVGVLMLFYQNQPQLIKSNYLAVFRMLFGNN